MAKNAAPASKNSPGSWSNLKKKVTNTFRKAQVELERTARREPFHRIPIRCVPSFEKFPEKN
jgi:hypothetical protein